jgi:hypothetical protein
MGAQMQMTIMPLRKKPSFRLQRQDGRGIRKGGRNGPFVAPLPVNYVDAPSTI